MSYSKYSGDITVVKDKAQFAEINKDVDSYAVISRTLKAFHTGPKLTLQLYSTHCQLTSNVKICDVLNSKEPFFCVDGQKNYEFNLGLGNNAIYVIMRAQTTEERKVEGFIENLGQKFTDCIVNACNELSTDSWTARHNCPVNHHNSKQTIDIYEADWINFATSLERLLHECFGNAVTMFLYYVARHGMKAKINTGLEELKRRINIDYEEGILFYQIHIALELCPPSKTAIFADLERVPDMGDSRNSNGLSFFRHIDRRYGHFAKMHRVFALKDVTYFGVYNPHFHKRRLTSSSTLLSFALMGKGAAFKGSPLYEKNFPAEIAQMLTNFKQYSYDIKKGIPARAEAVMTRSKLSEISLNGVDKMLNGILTVLLAHEILVYCQKSAFDDYIDKVSDHVWAANELYDQMEKPATKKELSTLLYIENSLIFCLEASTQWCNQSRLTVDSKTVLIIEELTLQDLKGSTLPFPQMKQQLINMYAHLPTKEWNEIPLAVDANGLINKHYVVLYLYTVYAMQKAGISILLSRNMPRYCPIAHLNVKFVQEHKDKGFFTTSVSFHAVAEVIFSPKTVVGAMISSFVYDEYELKQEKASLKQTMCKFIRDNGINVFPTILIEGSRTGIDQRSWSPLIDVKSVISVATFYGNTNAKKSKHMENVLTAHPSFRTLINLKQNRPRIGNPFAKINAERKKAKEQRTLLEMIQQATVQPIENAATLQCSTSSNERSINSSYETSGCSNEFSDMSGAGIQDENDECQDKLDSSDSIDFIAEIDIMYGDDEVSVCEESIENEDEETSVCEEFVQKDDVLDTSDEVDFVGEIDANYSYDKNMSIDDDTSKY